MKAFGKMKENFIKGSQEYFQERRELYAANLFSLRFKVKEIGEDCHSSTNI